MSEEIELKIYMMLCNTIRILGFIILSIIFHKWWIILFSILFLITWKNDTDTDMTKINFDDNVGEENK